jgi:hypothetical protein
MATKISAAAANAAVDAIVDLIDAGAAAGYVEVRTGGQPATVATGASGTLLVTIPLNDPAFSSTGGVATADVTPEPEGTAVATGTAGWFRVYDDNDVAIIDGLVGAEMTLNTTAITTGVAVRITAYTITQPLA